MKALILDTETHDLDGLPIEIAHVPFYFYQGAPIVEETKIFDEYFSVDVPISYAAMAVHHILESDIAGKPSHKTFKLPENTTYIIGHNVDYDIKAIQQCDPSINVKGICTLALARMVWPDAPAHTLSTLYYMLNGGNALTRRELRNAHNARADTLFTAFILEHIIDRLGITDLQSLFLHSEKARIPTKITFGKHKGTLIKDLPGDYVGWLLRQPDLDPYLHKALTGA